MLALPQLSSCAASSHGAVSVAVHVGVSVALKICRMHTAQCAPHAVQLAKWKPGAAEEQKVEQRAKRSERWSSQQQSSKQRLAELVQQHKAPSQQQARR